MTDVRPPAVAGSFYPGDAARLSAEVDRLLAGASTSMVTDTPAALIVPHAGYIYSGPIAATAYARLRPLAKQVRRVVLLGPAHYVAVRGLALPEAEAMATPLGVVPIDAEAVKRVELLPQVSRSRAAHAREHSLEVQLPFLQRVLEPGFTLVPFAVGRASAAEIAEVIAALKGGPETLILISSDLSHYLPYDEAKAVDAETARKIVDLKIPALDHEEACGASPIDGLREYARGARWSGKQLDLRSSGDTAGDRDRVVGYGAFAFAPAGERGAR